MTSPYQTNSPPPGSGLLLSTEISRQRAAAPSAKHQDVGDQAATTTVTGYDPVDNHGMRCCYVSGGGQYRTRPHHAGAETVINDHGCCCTAGPMSRPRSPSAGPPLAGLVISRSSLPLLSALVLFDTPTIVLATQVASYGEEVKTPSHLRHKGQAAHGVPLRLA